MSLPVYLPYSLGFLWLWSGIQPLVSASEASLTLLADVGVPLEGRWAVLMMASESSRRMSPLVNSIMTGSSLSNTTQGVARPQCHQLWKLSINII